MRLDRTLTAACAVRMCMEPPEKRVRTLPLADRLDARFADAFQNATPYWRMLLKILSERLGFAPLFFHEKITWK